MISSKINDQQLILEILKMKINIDESILDIPLQNRLQHYKNAKKKSKQSILSLSINQKSKDIKK